MQRLRSKYLFFLLGKKVNLLVNIALLALQLSIFLLIEDSIATYKLTKMS